MLTIEAPAKLNFTLEVLGKRPDGYHEIRSIIQTINLCDVLHFRKSERIEISSDLIEWSAEKSLISKAVTLLQKETSTSQGVSINIQKRIPLVSGLGGDSSDAAAVLKGLNQIWELNLPTARLAELAEKLGSDVPFFLQGGTALMEGRGEIIKPLPPIKETWFVLIVPGITRPEHKTEKLYTSLKPAHYTDGQITERLVKEIKAGNKISPDLLFNTFENVAFEQYAGLNAFRDPILKVGASNIHLAGSGPALFTVVADKTEGKELAKRLDNQGMELFLTSTLNPTK